MKVRDVMNPRPRTVRPHDKLSEAARVMWDHDCGWIPVVDDAGRVTGVITDRDICMAAFTRGMPLHDIAVEGTMSTNVFATHPGEPLENAFAAMCNYRVRRLPVVTEAGDLVGLLSLSDLTRRAAAKDSDVRAHEVIATLAAICEPRSASSAV
jgi:CBS domain-containing protein